MTKRIVKVIFDTNIWISFLIGRRLLKLKDHISTGEVILVTSDQLMAEIKIVTSKPKLKKYFPKESVKELLELIDTIAEKTEIESRHFICRDPKDNFLLDLIDFSKADYLVTGDKDLLALNPFKTAQILTPNEFEAMLS